MALRAIERIRMPDARTFYEQYVARRRPVIITDLFVNDPIREIDSLAQARAEFDAVHLRTRIEYIRALEKSHSGAGPVMTFGEYWDQASQPPSDRLICTECEIPARIMLQFSLPAACKALDLDRPEILDLPRRYGDHDLYTYVFMAPRGQTTHLHYDGDHRQILLYQVFGAKEFYLVEPSCGPQIRQLGTREGFIGMFGAFFGELSQADRHALVEEAQGYHAIVEPGEALYMPMLIWHHVEYLEDAMSINLRFGRNRLGRFLCIDNFHQDYFVQNFSALLGETTLADGRFAPAIETIVAAYCQPAADRNAKIRAMRELFVGLCSQYCPEAQAGAFYALDGQSPEFERVMQVMGDRMLYMSPPELARTRPRGAMSGLQKNLVRETAARHGYSQDVLQRIVANRLGKPSVDSLTKAEGVQLLGYLAAPEAQL